MKQKEIHRTATFVWSPASQLPVLATANATAIVEDLFSSDCRLEIWQPDFMNPHEFQLGADPGSKPKGVVTENSRFNCIAWSKAQKDRLQGVIAAGMQDESLVLWDPVDIIKSSGVTQAIHRKSVDINPIHSLDFNPIDTWKLASASSGFGISVWDLNGTMQQPAYTLPGTSKLGDFPRVAWNPQVSHSLAATSIGGSVVVFDTRFSREVARFKHHNKEPSSAAPSLSAIAWDPSEPTHLATASADDACPGIMLWDLRMRSGSRTLDHKPGVLSLSWCKWDKDLLLSCNKFGGTRCWNIQTSKVALELFTNNHEAFQIEWCPRNPDLFATAFSPGSIDIHFIQHTRAKNALSHSLLDGAASVPVESLEQPPKWLRRPVSASFGFGSQLVTVSNLQDAEGHQNSSVHTCLVQTEADFVKRALQLREATEENGLESFAKGFVDGEINAQPENVQTGDTWKALLSLFHADSRDELVTILGYSKTEVSVRVADAVMRLKETRLQRQQQEDQFTPNLDQPAHEPVVSFAEPELDSVDMEKTPSEVSTSDAPPPDGESTTTVPSLLGDDHIGTLDSDTGVDFFNTMAAPPQGSSQSGPLAIPRTSYGVDSSVAATIGSEFSSVAGASETLSLRGNTFRIYPPEESEMDQLVTKALVLGDFESAVELCLSTERYADALLLASKGGQDLLSRTQKVYFTRRTTAHPYLRLFQSIVTNDLADVVQNADLAEWAEIFVVLCAFASGDEFSGLAEQLGARLEFQAGILRAQVQEDASISAEQALGLRKTAMLTYLAAGRLERLVNIWIEEMAEEEACRVHGQHASKDTRYGTHAHALQSFIEKVTIFRCAVKFDDSDLSVSADNTDAAKTYKLAALYDRYLEYAEMLANQGLVKEVVAYLRLIPSGYTGSALDFAAMRKRLLAMSEESVAPNTSLTAAQKAPATAASTTSVRVQTPIEGGESRRHLPQPTYQPAMPAYQPEPSRNPYAPPQLPAKPSPLSQPHQTHSPASSMVLPHGQNGGWNDAPTVKSDRRTPQATSAFKPAAIVSPFPNAASPPPAAFSNQPSNTALPPPPRPTSVQNTGPPLPPHGRMPPPYARPLAGPGMIMPPPPPSSSPDHAGQLSVPPQVRATLPPPGPYAPPTVIHAPPVEVQSGPPPPVATGVTGPPRPTPYAPQPPQQISAPPGLAPQIPTSHAVAQQPTSTSSQGPPRAAPPVRGPPPPKYPPGDRSHIPEFALPIYKYLTGQIDHMKQNATPQQKRMLGDVEQRLDALFDALNCGTLSDPVVRELLDLTKAMATRDYQLALTLHFNLLMSGLKIDHMGRWMSGIKQLIQELGRG